MTQINQEEYQHALADLAEAQFTDCYVLNLPRNEEEGWYKPYILVSAQVPRFEYADGIKHTFVFDKCATIIKNIDQYDDPTAAMIIAIARMRRTCEKAIIENVPAILRKHLPELVRLYRKEPTKEISIPVLPPTFADTFYEC